MLEVGVSMGQFWPSECTTSGSISINCGTAKRYMHTECSGDMLFRKQDN